jgi:pilus assembly protein CpaF
MSTIHANSSRDALARIENMILMANTNLPVPAIRAQVASAIDLIIQVERMRDGVRRVVEVVEVCGLEGEVITTSSLFRFNYQGEALDGRVKGRFEANRTRPHCYPRLDYYGFGKAFMGALEQGAYA